MSPDPISQQNDARLFTSLLTERLNALRERIEYLETVEEPTGVPDVVIVADEKASGTNGGTFTQGAWRTRDINTERYDPAGICAIAANQIALAAGRYQFLVICPANGVNAHQARLYNITDAAEVEMGTTAWTSGTAVSTHSFVVGAFTITDAKVFEIQHECSNTVINTGFGRPANLGNNEVYTVAVFNRLEES